MTPSRAAARLRFAPRLSQRIEDLADLSVSERFHSSRFRAGRRNRGCRIGNGGWQVAQTQDSAAADHEPVLDRVAKLADVARATCDRGVRPSPLARSRPAWLARDSARRSRSKGAARRGVLGAEAKPPGARRGDGTDPGGSGPPEPLSPDLGGLLRQCAPS